MKILMAVIISLLVIIDQVIKSIVFNFLKPLSYVDLPLGIIRLHYTENTGAAFGIMSNYTLLLSIVTAVVLIAGIVYLMRGKFENKLMQTGFAMILSGGIGNLIDRIFRGFVIDYIEPLFIDFAVFNFADMLISIGAVLFLGYVFIDIIKGDKGATIDELKED